MQTARRIDRTCRRKRQSFAAFNNLLNAEIVTRHLAPKTEVEEKRVFMKSSPVLIDIALHAIHLKFPIAPFTLLQRRSQLFRPNTSPRPYPPLLSATMSAKTLLDQIDDLSEDDNDFIPEPKAKRTSKRRRSSDSGSDSSSDSDNADEEQAAKKAKVDPAEQERKEVQVQADFRSILDVEEEAKRERERGLLVECGEELVEIRRPRFYAGETI